MAAYVIADTEVLDREQIVRYRALSQAAVAKYGGRYLARGGAVETVEGSWNPKVLVILEFPSMEHAHAWYASPEYAQALAIRQTALTRDLIFVEGVAPASLG